MQEILRLIDDMATARTLMAQINLIRRTLSAGFYFLDAPLQTVQVELGLKFEEMHQKMSKLTYAIK